MNNTELKEKIEQMEKELAELKKAVKENDEPKFERVAEGKPYYYIFLHDVFTPVKATEEYTPYDDNIFALNNYFRTIERAEEVVEKIKMILKLERLHDTFCPDYVPDWKCENRKYSVYYDNLNDKYETDWTVYAQGLHINWFPTEEIALKVCNILNSEKEYENE